MRALALPALMVLLGCWHPATSDAQAVAVRGMVVDVEAAGRAIILETRAGRREVSIGADAAIRDQDGRPLTAQDLRSGDAVAVRVRPDGVTDLIVARQFWAIPPDD